MKTLDPNQAEKINRPYLEPLYFCHLFIGANTLYFSDRTFTYNGHNYEAYLSNLPSLALAINRQGGYPNFNASLEFRNEPFRDQTYLSEWFQANPPAKSEVDFYVLYTQPGETYGSDVSTKLFRASLGEMRGIRKTGFSLELFSILYALDQKQLFTQIGPDNWPDAAPDAVGKFENIVYGAVKRMPCPCVSTGAGTTLQTDLTAGATTVEVTDASWPIAFPSSGTVQIGYEKITYGGKSGNSLTGCTRGASSTAAAAHKAGSAVYEVKASYKFLAAGHVMGSLTNVYLEGLRLPAGDVTINLNDSGKATVTLTKKMLKKHSHGQKTTITRNGTGGSFSVTGSPYGESGIAANLYDNDTYTFCHVAATGSFGGGKSAIFTVTFPAFASDDVEEVWVCVECGWSLGSLAGEYFRFSAPETIAIGAAGVNHLSKHIVKKKISSLTVPTTVTVACGQNSGSTTLTNIDVYNIWIEVVLSSTEGTGDTRGIIAPVVAVDGTGYKDDGGGTYTGTPNALIDNPSDVRRHLLVALLGRNMSEIDASFGTARTDYDNQISGGYDIGVSLACLGQKASQIFEALDRQTRSIMREDGGKWYLQLIHSTDLLPSDGTGVSASSTAGGYPVARSCDNSTGTDWRASDASLPQWVKIDLGAGNEKMVRGLTITPALYNGDACVDAFTFEGSQNDSVYSTIYTGRHANDGSKETYNFANATAYRYYRLTITSSHAAVSVRIYEWEIFAPTFAMTVTVNNLLEEPVFGQTPAREVKNLQRGLYDIDLDGSRQGRKWGDYCLQAELSDGASVAAYGSLPEDTEFPITGDVAQVNDVLNWKLVQGKEPLLTASLLVDHSARILERGDLINLIYDLYSNRTWKALGIMERPERQAFAIDAIECREG